MMLKKRSVVGKIMWVLAFATIFPNISDARELVQNDKAFFVAFMQISGIKVQDCPPVPILRRQICGSYKTTDDQIFRRISSSISITSKRLKVKVYPLYDFIPWTARDGKVIYTIDGCNKPNVDCGLPSSFDYLETYIKLETTSYTIRVKSGFFLAFETKL